jgi:hypothetical protein
MSYEKGISKLLSKESDDETIKRINQLSLGLAKPYTKEIDIETTHPVDLQQILAELNVISYRTHGFPFFALCQELQTSYRSCRRISLTQVLLIIGLILFIPIGLTLFISSTRAQDILDRTSQIDETISEVDKRIASGVSSPYFLTRDDPCSTDVLGSISMQTINIEIITQEETNCIWRYSDSATGAILAEDKWTLNKQLELGYFVEQRTYYQNNAILAVDTFYPFETCFRRRIYQNTEGNDIAEICFSESGQAIEYDAMAPIPPIFYWFFYR